MAVIENSCGYVKKGKLNISKRVFIKMDRSNVKRVETLFNGKRNTTFKDVRKS